MNIAAHITTTEKERTEMIERTESEKIDKAVRDYNKRLEYNKIWREKNADKMRAIRSVYNKKRWIETKALLKIAKEQGKI